MPSASEYPDMFNDVFGPVMQPGSSSHLAGPCRITFLANCLLDDDPTEIKITLDEGGSMAGSFGVMAEDNAMLAGAMGILPDDPRVFDAASIAKERGIPFSFHFMPLKESDHPNAIKIEMTGKSGKRISLVGDSLGSGMIETRMIDGFPLCFRGDGWLLLVFGNDGELSEDDLSNIRRLLGEITSEGRVKGENQDLYFFKTPAIIKTHSLRETFPSLRVECLKALVPSPEKAGRNQPLFRTMHEWQSIADNQGRPLWEIAIEYQMLSSGQSHEEVFENMTHIARLMYRQTHAAIEECVMEEIPPYKYDYASRWKRFKHSEQCLTSDVTARIVELAYGACSCIIGVPTVPGPMGGGGGYIFAALRAVQEKKKLNDKEVVKALFVAGGIAAIAMMKTEPTGEQLGCWGECGTCGAMASAALVSMAGGTAEQIEAAASLMIQSCLGVACDPIPGGAGQPCRTRIMTACCMAPVFADMAMAGHNPLLSLDEAFDALDRVGRSLPPDLLCNSKGGCATAPSAQERAKMYKAWVEFSIRNNQARPPVF